MRNGHSQNLTQNILANHKTVTFKLYQETWRNGLNMLWKVLLRKPVKSKHLDLHTV